MTAASTYEYPCPNCPSPSDCDDRTAEFAFGDALLALRDVGCDDVADRLRARWSDVPDPTTRDAPQADRDPYDDPPNREEPE